jgi:hypothetical protein
MPDGVCRVFELPLLRNAQIKRDKKSENKIKLKLKPNKASS